jgi:hypothetical protein
MEGRYLGEFFGQRSAAYPVRDVTSIQYRGPAGAPPEFIIRPMPPSVSLVRIGTTEPERVSGTDDTRTES